LPGEAEPLLFRPYYDEEASGSCRIGPTQSREVRLAQGGEFGIAPLHFGGDRSFTTGIQQERFDATLVEATVQVRFRALAQTRGSRRQFGGGLEDGIAQPLVKPGVERDKKARTVREMDVEGASGRHQDLLQKAHDRSPERAFVHSACWPVRCDRPGQSE
jgi:hypothetical protein